MFMKKIIAIFAVSALACCALAGCGVTGGSGTASDKSSSAAEQSQEDSSKEESSAEESSEASDEESEEESSKEKSPASVPENVNEVLYEDDIVRITYTGLETDDWLGDGLKVTVENLSDKNITVQASEASVNGVMEDPYFSCDVAAGKKANDSITFAIDNEIGIVELSFHVYDSDTYDTIVDTDMITVTVNENVTVEKAEATKVYESNGVIVSYVGMETDEIWGTEFLFLIENNGTETYDVRADNISIDGVMCDGSMYAEVSAGKYANESISFFDEESLPAEKNELEFKIVISNSEYETVAESDPITIALN